MYCYDDLSVAIFETLRFGFFSSEVPVLIYYSHLTAVVVALALSFFIFVNNKSLPARILVVISLIFSALSILDIFLWTQIDARIVMFLWTFWLFLFITIYFLSFYFLYAFITEKDLAFRFKMIGILVLSAVLVVSVTDQNLTAFDVGNCSAVEGLFALNTVFALSFAVFLLAVGYGIYSISRITDVLMRRRAILATVGISLFLFSFSAATYIASIANFLGREPDTFNLEQYGYFGMTVFIAFLTYTIVRHRAFNTKLLATQALVAALVILIASQFFFIRNPVSLILNGIALLLSFGFGYFLVKSVEREIEHRRQVEQLAKRLKSANDRLKILDQLKSEFVSIASHQLRSPLTSIRGYASMLLEGSFGKLPQKAEEAITRIAESSKYMALSVEDYLNVSRIQTGNMKYNLSEFNLRDVAEAITDEARPQGVKKGLLITYASSISCKGMVKADIGKTRQIIQNLVDNAIKYTKQGTVEIKVRDSRKPNKIYVDVTDSGIGMSEETIEQLFGKFERAKNANEVNVTGTGLGLYVAKKMAEDMGGNVTARSEGEGKGSTFTFELPYIC